MFRGRVWQVYPQAVSILVRGPLGASQEGILEMAKVHMEAVTE